MPTNKERDLLERVAEHLGFLKRDEDGNLAVTDGPNGQIVMDDKGKPETVFSKGEEAAK